MKKQITSQNLLNLIEKKLDELPDEFGIPSKILKPKAEIIMSTGEFNKFVKKLMKYYKVVQSNGYLFAFYIINVDNEYFVNTEIKIYYETQENYIKIQKIVLYKAFC